MDMKIIPKGYPYYPNPQSINCIQAFMFLYLLQNFCTIQLILLKPLNSNF